MHTTPQAPTRPSTVTTLHTDAAALVLHSIEQVQAKPAHHVASHSHDIFSIGKVMAGLYVMPVDAVAHLNQRLEALPYPITELRLGDLLDLMRQSLNCYTHKLSVVQGGKA